MWRGLLWIASMSTLLVACAGVASSRAAAAPSRAPENAPLAQLWVDPGLEPRDLFWGVGGRRLAPSPGALYELDSRDDSGFSVSYDVVDPDGVEWSAKIGPEAQTEVVVSRILWGLGYHQPPVYYLPSWTTVDERGRHRRQSEARFRPKLERLGRAGSWPWADNPFSRTRQMKGLLVVLLMLNSTDLKDSNNEIYQLAEAWDGASRWYVVRDLGAALGETGKLYPRRNWLEGFERSGFLLSTDTGELSFDFDGRHQHMLDTIEPADVRWASERMERLTDAQLRDAFRAGNYAPEIADRYIRRIRQKTDDGLSVQP
jgi:hypothetical protein